MPDVLKLFDTKTEKWFQERLGMPTPVQEQTWPAVLAGDHVLVSAPTGTGKTLSAFLVFLDQLNIQADKGILKNELQLIYVSPLKSLAADIRENLKKPLEGIDPEERIRIAVRTGDTTQRERQQMLRKPPHILITTPESLYLLLTGKNSRQILKTAKAVILDELHALIDTKRGAHLMLSLARLDQICEKPLQRIGLSATIEPLDTAAKYLAPEKVIIVAPQMRKNVRLQILAPFAGQENGRKKDPIWEELSALVYKHCQGNRSVIAFVEGRRYAEKLAYYVNLLGGENFARVHHGSLSKEQRDQVESDLRSGELRLLCATSSMELGIDVGEIDQVLQVGCPKTISGTMQRLGRAGHNPGRTSVMYLFPRTAGECISCGMTAELARRGGVEHLKPPSMCFDVLSQHLVSMAACETYEIDDVMKLLKRAWPFRDVTKEDVKAVLEMLAGDYEHEKEIPARPRVLYDRIHERVEGDSYSRMLAVSAGGTIPDKGLFAVKTENGVKIGEVDEEFVYESRKGDRFLLGAFGWKILDISRDTVTVTQSHAEGARLPFWHGDLKGRSKEVGEAFGKILGDLQRAYDTGKLQEELIRLGMDQAGVIQAEGYLSRQIKATGCLPDHKTIIAEHFRDANGNSQIMIHSVFGKRINSPLSLLLADAAMEQINRNVGCVDEEDGILLYSYSEETLPDRLLHAISPERCEAQLSALLPATPLFNIAFRYNSARALMMGIRKNTRQPLWMQRLRSAELLDQVAGREEHPLIRETKRECLEDLWDIDGLMKLLRDIRAGRVVVREITTENPSPMSLPLQWGQEASVMYDYSPTPRGVYQAVEEARMAEKLSRNSEKYLLPGEEEIQEQLVRKSTPQDERQLHSFLMAEGDVLAGEIEVPIEWMEKLALEGRALYLEQGLWIAAEHADDYRRILSDDTECEPNPEIAVKIVRRMLRYRGGATADEIAYRYGWKTETAEKILQKLCLQESVVKQDEYYFHAVLYARARTKTIKNRREQIKTVPAENYSALLFERIRKNIPGEEALRGVLKQYSGSYFPASFWESIIFPFRVKNYREKLLDSILSEGEFFWKMENGMIKFDLQEEIDWDREINVEKLSQKETLIYQTLVRRGASFMQNLNGILQGESPYDTLLSLMEKGLLYTDSFLPVRQWKEKEKSKKASAKQRVNVRVKALNTGRWDLVRPLKQNSIEKELERVFERYVILCRETARECGISWHEALNILRIWEYTGQVRRGYFVEGLSGAQFLRTKDFESVTDQLEHPDRECRWLNAADPVQIWGKLVPHKEGREFLNVAGTCVAFRNGMPVATLERQGKILRVLQKQEDLTEILKKFADEFLQGNLFREQKRVVVREYPMEAGKALQQAGFIREMQDFVLYH